MIYFEYAYSKKSSHLTAAHILILLDQPNCISRMGFQTSSNFTCSRKYFNQIQLTVYLMDQHFIQQMWSINADYYNIKKCIEIYIKQQYKEMSKIPDSFKGISNEIESQISERDCKGHKIPKSILEKYLKVGDQDIFDKLDNLTGKITPVWSITLPSALNNMKGIATSTWPFSQQNKSIYFVVWGPISLVFFTYLLHNSPYQNHFLVFSGGLIHLWLILILGYIGYVFSNILKFPFASLYQHLCVSSHVNIITILYSCICTGAPRALIICATVFFIVVMSYLHFNLYNKAIKPSLLEFIILLILTLVIYTGSAILFYHTFISNTLQINQEINSHLQHFSLRNFSLHQ